MRELGGRLCLAARSLGSNGDEVRFRVVSASHSDSGSFLVA